jgi:Kelch motif
VPRARQLTLLRTVPATDAAAHCTVPVTKPSGAMAGSRSVISERMTLAIHGWRRALALLVALGAAACSSRSPSASPTAVANGTLGAWRRLSPMPEPRANHCSVAANGYLVVIGGNHAVGDSGAFVNLDEVDVAKLNADGTLGAWQVAGKTPSPVSDCTATASGSTVYLVDGIFTDSTDQARVWSAPLSSSGKLGAWKALGALPANERVLHSEAWVSGGTLFAMVSKLPGDGDVTATIRASVAHGLGAWSESDWLPGFRGRPEYAFTGKYVYTLGGYESGDAGNPTVADVSGAPVAKDGSVGAPFSTTALPAPTTFGRVEAVDDYLFLVGGKPDIYAPGVARVASARIAADGTLTAWTAEPSLPEPRTNEAAVVAGDYLYVTGGGSDGPGLDSVFVANVRH